MKNPYTIETGSNALGITHEVHGPGMPRYANELMFIQLLNDWSKKSLAEEQKDQDGHASAEHYAERLRGFLAIAYHAGRDSLAQDVCTLLGAK